MAYPEILLTEAETAERLRWKKTTLQRRRWAGLPPQFLKIGRSVRYDPEVIETFIESGRRVSTSESGPEANA